MILTISYPRVIAKQCFVILSCFLLLSLRVLAQQIYVTPHGDDKNPGTKEKPVKSLTAARDLARVWRKGKTLTAPIEILIAPGKYYMNQALELNSGDAGSKDSPLVFRNLTTEKPIFYGGILISGFSSISNGLWKTHLTDIQNNKIKFEQLYVNGHRAIRAQEPDSGFFQAVKVSEEVLSKGNGPLAQSAIQKISLTRESNGWLKNLTDKDITEVIVKFYHKWDNTIKPIQSYKELDSSFTIMGSGMKPWNPINDKSFFVLENIKSGLDSPGEWYLEDNGDLFYKPQRGEKLENCMVIAPVLDQLIKINGTSIVNQVSNIRFENLSFQVAAYKLPTGGAEPSQAAAQVPAAIQINFADNIAFKNCEIAHTGGSGISFGRACSYSLIQNCYLHDLGSGAIKIGETTIRKESSEITHHIKVDNSILTDGGKVFPCAVALSIFHGHDNTISHNEISNFKYSGISVGWVWGYTPSPSKRNIIEFNNIHHLGWGVLSDMGGIYTLGLSEGTVIRNNNVNNIYAQDYGGWGIYTDEGSTGVLIENNLVYKCKSAAFHQHYGRNNTIRNNIFVDNLKAELQATKIEPHQSFSFTNNIIVLNKGTLLSSNWSKLSMVSDSNIYWDSRGQSPLFDKLSFTDWQKTGQDTHSIVANPGFTNTEISDFHFKTSDIIQKIGFKPFDYGLAGVYGSQEWKRLSKLPTSVISSFSRTVTTLEK